MGPPFTTEELEGSSNSLGEESPLMAGRVRRERRRVPGGRRGRS